MSWQLLAIILVLLFGFVLLFGAPYVPTLKPQTEQALDLLNLKPGQTLLELGSGDGRVMRAAAARGLNVVGYELNPLLALVSLVVTWKYRKQVRVVWGSIWRQEWPQAEGVFIFMIDRFMPRLNKRFEAYARDAPLRVVSFAYKIPNKKIIRSKKGIHLYEY
jgi:16S rRNA A1518/A1519 N6-dimethyltransferase RsmA/KsgA/DIM1 with predicted DNA glycosylase/AP lyase activity